MIFELLPALAGYIPRDRVENILRPEDALPEDGVALIADISGFTPLTEALTHGLSPDQGAEELTRALEGVFTPLIQEIHAFRGSVIKFGGDALIVWYARELRVRRAAVIRRALTSAWRMQQAIALHGQVPTPIGIVTLKMKVGLTYGPIKRFNLGRPEYGYEDILGGKTLDHMAEAEHQAEPGEIIVDAETLAYVPDTITVTEWRDHFAVLGQLRRPARPKPWPLLNWSRRNEDELIAKLKPYVPPQIYESLASGHDQVAELKPVVSLFVQFHGIDYDADPEVGDKLQTYFTRAQTVVARYDGRLNRLITGDKGSLIHIIFGAPRTVEEQEVRAIRCALDLQQECGGLTFITMQRIGVTVGRVFAGPVGSAHRHDYTTMGDSINLSARLMQNAADNQILLEAAVQAQLDDSFEIADLGEIMVKGKSEPISIFAALAARNQPSSTRQLSPRAHPLFGRDKEMALLQQQLARLRSGRGSVITLVGEVGLGKTHILEHLRAQVETTMIWAGGICLAYGQTLSGYLFIDLLRDLVALPTSGNPEAASQHLANFCADLFGPSRLEATYPYLARFMGLPLDEETTQHLDALAGESLRWQLLEVIREMLVLLSRRQPLVLTLDDLQWADPTSLQLAEAILPLATNNPILVLMAMRPEQESQAWVLRRQPLATAHQAEPALDIVLTTLDRAAATALIAYHTPGLPQHILDYLIEKGGGNPLFLVEIARTLEAQGLLSGGVDLDSITIDALDLPDSVQGLLLAQIDRLAVEARHVLQMASVIGKIFLQKVLAVLAAGEQQLSEHLSKLISEDYVLPTDQAELDLAYTFRHILIQESAYNTLLYERRRAYHRQVAEALKHLFPTQLDEQAAVLAFHYEQAGNLDQAIHYHLQAADRARLLYANEEAEALYHNVLTLLDQEEADGAEPDLERRAKTYLKIAQVRANSLDFEGAQEFYNRGFDLLERVQTRKFEIARLDATKLPQRVIRLGIYEQTTGTLDPGLSAMSDELEVIYNLFEGLIELDTELNVIPAQAQRWQIDEEGRRYQFELRRNLKWSDGAPLTAHDFVFAWRRNLDPHTNAPFAPYLYVVQGAEEFHQGQHFDPNLIGIKALDDFNLEVTLKIPAGYFPYLLAHSITYPQPAHVVQVKGFEWTNPKNLICNGPFKVTSRQEGREMSLERNSFYRGLITGNLELAALRFIQPNLKNYVNNEIDVCLIDDQGDIPTRYPNEVFVAQYLETFYLGFSHHFSPFDNKLVCQAFAKCINRKELVREVWANVQRAAMGGMVPPGMPGHSPEIGLRFDPVAARNLLRQAGFDTGKALPPLTLAALPGFNTLPTYLQASWQEHLDVKVQLLENVSFDELIPGLEQGLIQLSLFGFLADYPDPDNILRVLFHSTSPTNLLGWKNKQFDQLVDQAATLTDQQARLSLYHQADKILVAEDPAITPLYYRRAYGLLRPGFKVEGIGRTIRGGTFKLKNILATQRQS